MQLGKSFLFLTFLEKPLKQFLSRTDNTINIKNNTPENITEKKY
jgi:hypothetical protein